MKDKKRSHIDTTKANAIKNYVNELPEDINIDIEEQKREFYKRVRRNPYRKYYRYSAAAVAIAFMVSGFMLSKNNFTEHTNESGSKIVNNTIEIGDFKAKLTLEDGSTIDLGKENSRSTEDAVNDGEHIIYNKSIKNQLVYNTLEIPRGGKYRLTLSDGTEVWLNAASKLRYPVNFIEGSTREVELLYGEAYFDVTPSSDNKGTSFKVLNAHQDIEVLGTEFNVKAYQDEANIYTTLVEGKVKVGTDSQSELLEPNYQSVFDINSQTFKIKNVDASDFGVWRQGILSFKNESLASIMTTMSRWYDMDVVFENKALMTEQYIGVFNREQKIETVMELLKELQFINDYSINKNTVTLK